MITHRVATRFVNAGFTIALLSYGITSLMKTHFFQSLAQFKTHLSFLNLIPLFDKSISKSL